MAKQAEFLTPHLLAHLRGSDAAQYARTGTVGALLRYDLTKLLDVFLALNLAALAGDAVLVSSVHPGFCESDFLRDAPWWGKAIFGCVLGLRCGREGG